MESLVQKEKAALEKFRLTHDESVYRLHCECRYNTMKDAYLWMLDHTDDADICRVQKALVDFYEGLVQKNTTSQTE